MKQQLIKSLVILFAIFCSWVINAQETSFSPYKSSSKWKLNFNVSPVLTRLKSDIYSSEEKSKPGYGIGVDLAYYFKNIENIRLGVSLGVDYGSYKVNRNTHYNDSAWITDADSDRLHIYEQASISEKQTVSYISVPLKLHIDYSITDQFKVYANAGYFFALALSGKYSTNAVLSRQGYYPRYNLLIYDVDVAESDFFYPTNKPVSDNRSLELKSNSGILAAIGMNYKLNSCFSLFAGIKTSIGLKNISNYSGNEAKVITGSNHTVKTLMSRGDKIKTNSYGLEFGISVNIDKSKKQRFRPS